jgi:hypothetical protein
VRLTPPRSSSSRNHWINTMSHMDAEQDSEGEQHHTDGAEPTGRVVPEMEADTQTFDEQISEMHTAEHRAATISSTEMVHGQAREPPRQTWRVAAVEGRSRVLVLLPKPRPDPSHTGQKHKSIPETQEIQRTRIVPDRAFNCLALEVRHYHDRQNTHQHHRTGGAGNGLNRVPASERARQPPADATNSWTP